MSVADLTERNLTNALAQCSGLVEQRRQQWSAVFTVRKLVMGFDELYDAFQSECISFSAIGKANGVSRERIRQIYQKWFADLFDAGCGWDRVKTCTVVNHAVLAERLTQTTPMPKWQAPIWEAARRKGLTPRALVRNLRVVPNAAMVGDKKVKLNRLTSSSTSYRAIRKYGRLCVTALGISKYNVHIVLVDKSLLFIIPSFALAEFRAGSLAKNCIAYIPVSQNDRGYALEPIIDFWQYNDAWHVLTDA